MKKNGWVCISLLMILPVVFLNASCAKKRVQSDSVMAGLPQMAQPRVQAESSTPMTRPDAEKTAERAAKEAARARQLQEERLQAEAAVREAAKTQFVKENIHFAFDSAALSHQAQQVLKNKADYLRTNPAVMVTVEGHCDERGADDYNIALGELRAESVKNFLVALGIGGDRMNTISFGEERPLQKGHDEASWAKNRRAQMVIN